MYATHDDLVNRFGALAVAELESMHNDGLLAVANALSDASEKMNSYLSVRYNVPIVNTEHLKLVCADIARYLLFMNEPTDEVEARYREAIVWLKDVAANKANVTFAEPLSTDEQSAVYSQAALPVGDSYHGQVFGDAVFATMPNVRCHHDRR